MKLTYNPIVSSPLKVVYRADFVQEKKVPNCIDYGARFYNTYIKNWMGVDPLADMMPSWSPYNYMFNNPVNLIDAWGLNPEYPGDPTIKSDLQWLDSDVFNDDGSYLLPGLNVTDKHRFLYSSSSKYCEGN